MLEVLNPCRAVCSSLFRYKLLCYKVNAAPILSPSTTHQYPSLSFSSSLHALATPLILHANRNRRLRELLLRLGLAVRLVFLAHRLAADVLALVARHTQLSAHLPQRV